MLESIAVPYWALEALQRPFMMHFNGDGPIKNTTLASSKYMIDPLNVSSFVPWFTATISMLDAWKKQQYSQKLQ